MASARLLAFDDESAPEGYEWVYSTYITLRSGRRLYAANYGKKAFRFLVRVKAK
jgi:hypothetical protein